MLFAGAAAVVAAEKAPGRGHRGRGALGDYGQQTRGCSKGPCAGLYGANSDGAWRQASTSLASVRCTGREPEAVTNQPQERDYRRQQGYAPARPAAW